MRTSVWSLALKMSHNDENCARIAAGKTNFTQILQIRSTPLPLPANRSPAVNCFGHGIARRAAGETAWTIYKPLSMWITRWKLWMDFRGNPRFFWKTGSYQHVFHKLWITCGTVTVNLISVDIVDNSPFANSPEWHRMVPGLYIVNPHATTFVAPRTI